MKRTCWRLLSALGFAAFVAAVSSAQASECCRLKYGNGKTFLTEVLQPRYIGQLPTRNKTPYLVFSGRTCINCDANLSIYIHSPSDGPMLGKARDPHFSYPGQYRDPETEQLAYVVRTFIGNCLESSNDPVVLWFQRERKDSGQWERRLYVAQIVDDRLESHAWTKDPPKLSAVLAAKKRGCREIKGIRDYLEP